MNQTHLPHFYLASTLLGNRAQRHNGTFVAATSRQCITSYLLELLSIVIYCINRLILRASALLLSKTVTFDYTRC